MRKPRKVYKYPSGEDNFILLVASMGMGLVIGSFLLTTVVVFVLLYNIVFTGMN